MFDLSDKFTRMLTCTLLAGGGALVATLVPGGLAAGLAVFAGGISGGILSGDIHSDLLTRIRNQSDLLKNGDLAKVAAHAAASVIRSLVEDREANLTSGQREQLRILANELEARWESYVARPDWNVQLEGVTESDLPDFFREVEQNVHQRKALTPEIWKELLRDVATQSKRSIDDKSLTLAATWLHDRFAQALWGVAKEESAGNGPTGGKGFAALQLMMLGQILDGLDSLEQSAKHSQEQLDLLRRLQIASTRGIVRLLRLHHAQIQAQFAALPERILEHLRGHLKEDLTVKPNNLPASLGTLFKGRETFLELMREKLASGKAHAVGVLSAQAIHGLGGVGKTRAVVEYAWRHQEEFSAVLFVTADSPESLRRNLAELVGPLVLDIKAAQQTPDQGARVAAAIQWLQAHKGWFLILDNVDNKEIAAEVEKLVGGLTQGQIVVTSQLSKWSAAVEPLQLDVLAPEDGRDFLLERTERHRTKLPQDAQLALDIAHDVDGLALALEQAGAYIGALEISLAEYRRRWDSKREQVLVWHDEQLMQYPKSLATTWEVSFEQLTPAGRTLLEHLAWFAPELIPEFVFDEERAMAKWEELLSGADVRMALADLRRYSLLRHEQSPETTGFLVHRLVQEITRRRVPEDDKRQRMQGTLELINRCCLNDPPPSDVRSWPRWEPLEPHVETVLTAADAAEITNPTTRLMNDYGLFLEARVRYGEAERWYRRAVQLIEATHEADDSQVAPYLNNLAKLLYVTNRRNEAEPLMRRALDIGEATFGQDHPTVAIRLNNLAQLLKDTNRLDEAEPLMRRALAIDETSFGPEHPKVAIRLNNLAQLLQATNRLDEAEPLYRRALAIDEASFGPEHPDVAIDLNNLAQLLKTTNRLEEAEPLMRRALAIDGVSLGPDHPSVARDLNNLAQLLQDTNRLDEAEPLMRRAVGIFRSSLGDEHPHTQGVQRNYDHLLAEMQKR